MADRKPFICIGMPVYNGEMFIRQALDSLLAQSYENFQLIISDNASTDATREICEEYAIKDIRIKYLRQKKNLGATNNFKYVLEQASGDYFMWAAHDDEWDARFIDTLIKVLEANKNVSVAFCQTIYKLKPDDKKQSTPHETELPMFLQGVPLNSPSLRPLKNRLNYAVDQNFGEMFYGIFRKKHLISDNAVASTIDFEKCDVIHVVLKATSTGDAFVSRDFYFTKCVTKNVFLWTYLCAREKSKLSFNESIEKMLEGFRDEKLATTNNVISRLNRYFRVTRSILAASYFHWQFLIAALKTIKNLDISQGKWTLSLRVIAHLIKSIFWTVYAKIKWSFY